MTNKQEILTEVQTVRDELRVRLHLLSMDVRERLQELELDLDNLERKVAQGGEKATQAVADRARGVIESVNALLHGQAGLSLPARAVMTTSVRACSPGDSANHAAQIFWNNDCGVIPVVDGDGRLLGMLTDRDVCMAAYTQGRRLSDIAVESAMSTPVQAVSENDSLERVLTVMSQAQVHRVPVVDDARRLVGIIALADLARWIKGLRAAHPSADKAVLGALMAISSPAAAAPAVVAAE